MIYIVESKKNKRPDDHIYVLVNSEKKSTPFDIKDMMWDYFDEDDPLLTHQESQTPLQE